MSKFTKISAARDCTTMSSLSSVDAFTTLLVNKEGWRRAALYGGRASLSGLTLEPTWVEEGAVWAQRSDMLHKTLLEAWRGGNATERLINIEEALRCVPETVLIFDRHGTDPENITELEGSALVKEIRSWAEFRAWITGTPPRVTSPEGAAARRATRDLQGVRLTAGEALEGLPARSDKCSLEISSEQDEDGEYAWEVIADPLGRATGFSTSKEVPPTSWGFERNGETRTWRDGEWDVSSMFWLDGPKGPGWYGTRWRAGGKVETQFDFGDWEEEGSN